MKRSLFLGSSAAASLAATATAATGGTLGTLCTVPLGGKRALCGNPNGIPDHNVLNSGVRLSTTNYAGLRFRNNTGAYLPGMDGYGAVVNGIVNGTTVTTNRYGQTSGMVITPTHPIWTNQVFKYGSTTYYPNPHLQHGFVRWTDPTFGGGAAWFDASGNYNVVYSGFGVANTVVVHRVRPLQGGHGVVTWPGCAGAAAANLGALAALAGGLGAILGMAGGKVGQIAGNGLTLIGGAIGVSAMNANACPKVVPGDLISGPDTITDILGSLDPNGGTLVAGSGAPDGGGAGSTGTDSFLLC